MCCHQLPDHYLLIKILISFASINYKSKTKVV
uniref:Uncharacterized protein n=1 Tax=Rhizophora mucronata TaxID=61149 RepID=A0A2P2PP51_RHIMU